MALMLVLLLCAAWYIHANKAAFLAQITTQANERINGQLTIEDMEPSLIRSFPNISIALKKVVLRDSLYAQHQQPLLDVDYIFVRVNTWSLLRKHVDVKEITLQDGAIRLFTDSTGYSNTYVLQRKENAPKKTPGRQADFRKIILDHIRFVIDNRQKLKLFDLEIKSLEGKVQSFDSSLAIHLNTNILSHSFAFNTSKGSYLKGKVMDMRLDVTFNKHSRVLDIPQQEIRIDGKPVKIKGDFVFATQPPAFHLLINVNQVLLSEAASWLSPNISSKLNTIGLGAPLDAEAELNGHMKYRDTPHVVVTWKTANNVLTTSMGEWTDCSFTGRFNNEVIPTAGHNDENSAVNIFNLSAKLSGVNIKADTIRVVNLKQPLLRGHFRSQFPLTDLNASQDMPLQFSEGNANVDLYYTGPVLKDDQTPSSLRGIAQVSKSNFVYLPRELSFHDCSATLRFTGQDLLLENIRLQTGHSNLQMDGKVKDILHFYFSAPEKIVIDWNIRSEQIDLNEFKSFLAPRKKGKAAVAARKARMGKVSQQLDQMLAASNVNMQVLLNKLVYKHFTAQQVKASLLLTQTDILLNQISLQHAGGSLQVKGNVHQQGNNNIFKLNANMNNVSISQLFYAFDNFGMEALSSKNLRGTVSAKADLKGNVLDNGALAKHSLSGSVSFNLKQGALLHFGPLEDIGQFVFRRRHLDSITFENLSNTFRIDGSKIFIPPMTIASSAVNIDMQGVYGLNGGTNISLDIPLRNPQKDADITDKEEKRRRSRKGIIIHLHAVSEKDGKVKIKLGKGDN